MDNKKRRFKVTIQGEDYTIIGDKNDEHMKVVEKMVDEQVSQIKGLSEKITTEEAAILVAINAVSKQVDMQEALLAHDFIEEHEG